MGHLSQGPARDVDSIDLGIQIWIFPKEIHAGTKRRTVARAGQDQRFKDPRHDQDVRVDQQANLPSLTNPGIQVCSTGWELRLEILDEQHNLSIMADHRPLMTGWWRGVGNLDHPVGSEIEQK